MNLVNLMASLKDAVDVAEFNGIKLDDVKVSARDSEGREYKLKDVYSVVRTLNGIVIQIEE